VKIPGETVERNTMIVRSISGSDIDHALTTAMFATLDALVDEGLLSKEQATEFADSHICIPMTDIPVWSRIKKWMGCDANLTEASIPTILKVVAKRFNSSR
jgi:hypothetical protein